MGPSFVHIWDLNLVIRVPADGLVPNGAMPSTGTVLTDFSLPCN